MSRVDTENWVEAFSDRFWEEHGRLATQEEIDEAFESAEGDAIDLAVDVYRDELAERVPQ
ncbi:MAG: hypothetical protein QME66_04320 [Candidatus Eisenbacteria bacterium]|nr:hypothetical protein [Candidatus Eisenbacteria bacterium]